MDLKDIMAHGRKIVAVVDAYCMLALAGGDTAKAIDTWAGYHEKRFSPDVFAKLRERVELIKDFVPHMPCASFLRLAFMVVTTRGPYASDPNSVATALKVQSMFGLAPVVNARTE